MHWSQTESSKWSCNRLSRRLGQPRTTVIPLCTYHVAQCQWRVRESRTRVCARKIEKRPREMSTQVHTVPYKRRSSIHKTRSPTDCSGYKRTQVAGRWRPKLVPKAKHATVPYPAIRHATVRSRPRASRRPRQTLPPRRAWARLCGGPKATQALRVAQSAEA